MAERAAKNTERLGGGRQRAVHGCTGLPAMCRAGCPVSAHRKPTGAGHLRWLPAAGLGTSRPRFWGWAGLAPRPADAPRSPTFQPRGPPGGRRRGALHARTSFLRGRMPSSAITCSYLALSVRCSGGGRGEGRTRRGWVGLAHERSPARARQATQRGQSGGAGDMQRRVDRPECERAVARRNRAVACAMDAMHARRQASPQP